MRDASFGPVPTMRMPLRHSRRKLSLTKTWIGLAETALMHALVSCVKFADRRLLDVHGPGVLDVDADQRERWRARDAGDVEAAQRHDVGVTGVDYDARVVMPPPRRAR